MLQKVANQVGAAVREQEAVIQLGAPIPGYSGTSRRVQADNIFGMTFNEARRMALESQTRIDVEKDETLAETSKWIPEDQRIQASK